MAPSSNSATLIALLVAFAVVAPGLHPSAAARDGGAAKDSAAPAPSPSGEVLHPMSFFDDIFGHLPDLPLPRILPCPPAFPIKIPFIPCYNVTLPPPVTECRSSLAKYMPPCARFLTDDSSPSSPPRKCCNAIQPFFHDESTTPLCLCHVVNGDVGKLFQAPVNHTRATSFLQDCGFGMSSEQVSTICAGSGTIKIPPMDAPSPPPRWRHGTKA